MTNKFSIAIDGPAGAGKSTMSRLIAKRFGIVYVDTGALYRTVGWYIRMMGIGSKDQDGVRRLINEINIDMYYDEYGVQRMILNGQDVTDEIRTPEMSVYASNISSMGFVRKFLLSMQREMAEKYSVIMDGRDIGTVVLPNADLKIYLTASPETRAERRLHDLELQGVETTLEQVLDDINERDKNDSTRKESPLKMANDAVLIDTTGESLEQTEERITDLIKRRLGL